MAANSKIEWTDATWNPIVGCSVVSPGCTNCYAMRMAGRIEAMGPSHYDGTTQASKAGRVWTGKVALAPDSALLAPLRRRKPTTYFVNSMGDIFHENVPDEWINQVFAVMALCPQHTFQVLTKRSARICRYMSDPAVLDRVVEAAHAIRAKTGLGDTSAFEWPMKHLWLGVSCEDQTRADERVPDLLATPAAVRFISAEPLLGPIDLERLGNLGTVRAAMPSAVERIEDGRPSSGCGSISGAQVDAIGPRGSSVLFFQTPDAMGGFVAISPRQWPRLDWIVVGGESGPGARPMHPAWARSIRDQCAAADVAFHFKQWGEWAHSEQSPMPCPGPTFFDIYGRPCGTGWHFWTDGDRGQDASIRVGKKAAGRILDGVEHNGIPAAPGSSP